jgi:hypothetical protein
MHLLEQLARLLGVASVGELAERLANALKRTERPTPDDAGRLLIELARREQALGPADNNLTPAAALAAIAAIDTRVAVMTALARQLGYSASIALGHEEFVRRLYEDNRFVGKEPKGELPSFILPILKRCDSGIDQDDLELFLEGEQPSLFFYETVRAHAELLSEAPDVEEEDDVDQDDDELEDTDQPVRAYVKPFMVWSLFEMVQEGALDVEPDWQRTDVWSLKRKRELVKSLILGIPLPSIILHLHSSGGMSIIDGKQRLLSIVKFMRNEYKLPQYDVADSSRLHPCRGAFYSKDGKLSLPDDLRRNFRMREIPALLFEDVPESRLRSIFHLYNVSGMKLNAAEIRNAVYQANPIHKAVYVLAGEGNGRTDLGIGGLHIQEAFKARLRAAYPGANRRYQGMDFLARYLGYSRAAQADVSKPFAHPSTSAAVNNYFDHRSKSENPIAVAREIIQVFDAAARFFDLSDVRLAFFTRGADGKRKFSKLAATTHMVAARFLLDLIEGGVVSETMALAAAEAVDIRVPEKQQSATIWDYQARVLIALRDALGANLGESTSDSWSQFFMKMEFCILPPEETES